MGYSDGDLIKQPCDTRWFVAKETGKEADFIKLVAECDGMTQEDHNAIVQEAHRYIMKAATHMDSYEAFKMVIMSGTDFIQHLPEDMPISDEMANQVLQPSRSRDHSQTLAPY